MVKGARPSVRDRLVTPPFVVASLAHFLHALAYYLFLSLPGFLRGLGASEVTIGALVGAAAAAAIVGRPPLGRVMDTRGRKVVMLVGGALATGVCASYLLVDRLGPLLVGLRLLHGMAEAMLFASLFAFAADIVPESRRIEGIALFGVSGMLPISIGSVVGDQILKRGPDLASGYRTLFLTSAALAGAALLLSLPLKEAARARGGEPARGMLAAIRQRDLVPLWVGGVVFATCLAAPFTFFATFVMTEPIATAGLFFSCYSIAAITLRIFAGKLPEKLGAKRVLLPAMGLVAAGLAVLVVARSPLAVAFAGVLSGMGHGYTFPIQLGLLVSRARPSERGAALAIFTALFDAGSMLGNPLFGHLVPAIGYRAMFGTSAAMMVVGTAVFAWMDRRHR